ncbi:DOMON domain-containing protein frrs1L [Homalodisca vitripennis]|nr:DOMON domain-containing protein frrs1L [Homalodisca vitripennis]
MLPGAGVTVWLALPALLLAAEDLDSSTCLTLDPFDSALPQTTPSPYTLSCSKTGKITNQDSIIFTIKSSRPRVDFRRFVVQALDRESGVAVGMFVDTGDADITVVNCFCRSENTAIEFDTEPKTEARMRWMSDFDYEGKITYLATIVQSGEIFWLREKGDSISVYNPW